MVLTRNDIQKKGESKRQEQVNGSDDEDKKWDVKEKKEKMEMRK